MSSSRRTSRSAALVCSVLLVAAGLGGAGCRAPAGRSDDCPASSASFWIGRLADASFARRDEATRRLVALGGLALPALQRHANAPDPETRWRVRVLLRRFEASGQPVALLDAWAAFGYRVATAGDSASEY